MVSSANFRSLTEGSRCAVVGVQGEKQWGENTALRSSSANCMGDGWMRIFPVSRSCWCAQAGHQMSLCVEHMACCLLVPCAPMSIVCPPHLVT